jgi:uncharacterized HAD superfamily protein
LGFYTNKEEMKKSLKIAVDLDGTLTTETNGWDDESCLHATPNQKMIDVVNQAWRDGHTIIIYTARRWSRREATIYWLQKNDVKYHTIEMQKLNFDVLIDDKAYNVKDLQRLNGVL